MSESSMPAAFFGHGSPMNVLEHNRYTEGWNDFGKSIYRPQAIVVVSAHWYIGATAVTAMKAPRTIHDFYGFPQELFDVQYSAPGSPEVAQLVADIVAPTWVGQDSDSWGLDHGTWSVLHHMFPHADIPVVQLSIDATKSFDDHLALGAALAPLTDQGILFLGSGNIVHNLSKIMWSTPDAGEPWAHRFDDDVQEILTYHPEDIASIQQHPDFARAVPTPEHFIPILYVAGVGLSRRINPQVSLKGYSMGSLSMTSYVVNP